MFKYNSKYIEEVFFNFIKIKKKNLIIDNDEIINNEKIFYIKNIILRIL